MTPQPLSPQQVDALHALRQAGSMTTEAFVELPFVHSIDQARNLLSRLEKRGHIAGDGHGRRRVWTYISTPELETSLGPPDGPSSSRLNGSSPGTGVRTYVVLEERDLMDLVAEVLSDAGIDTAILADPVETALREAGKIYDPVDEPEARNTEHALRVAAKNTYGQIDAEPRMVAVADRMFKIETVRVRNAPTVSIA
jgi:hypothetical protein